MSGFEIVGVIVGAIPLIVSGLEHYSAGVRPAIHSRFQTLIRPCLDFHNEEYEAV